MDYKIGIAINKIVVSNKLPFGKQDSNYFTGYKDAEIIKRSCILHRKMVIYRRDFDKTKYMYFL